MVLSSTECMDRIDTEIKRLEGLYKRKRLLLDQELEHRKSQLEQNWKFKAEQAKLREEKKEVQN